jgi:hypothetical protein
MPQSFELSIACPLQRTGADQLPSTFRKSASVHLSHLSEETPPKVTVVGLGEHLDFQTA